MRGDVLCFLWGNMWVECVMLLVVYISREVGSLSEWVLRDRMCVKAADGKGVFDFVYVYNSPIETCSGNLFTIFLRNGQFQL